MLSYQYYTFQKHNILAYITEMIKKLTCCIPEKKKRPSNLYEACLLDSKDTWAFLGFW
jgi:hypothetical protein